jgi:hypothetical protein
LTGTRFALAAVTFAGRVDLRATAMRCDVLTVTPLAGFAFAERTPAAVFA